MLKRFTDLHIHCKHSEGTDSVEEIVKRAEKLDLNAIVIVDYVNDKRNKLDEIKEGISKIDSKVNVFVGVEIAAQDIQALSSLIDFYRNQVDVLMVSGGDLEVNRKAVENPKVDVLTHPEYKRRDCGVDDVLAQLAAQNGVAIELNFNDFLRSFRKVRTYILTYMSTNVQLAQKFGTNIIISSGALSLNEMRAGRELASLGCLAGMNVADAINAVTATSESIIVKRKREKDKDFVMPGVEIMEEGG